MFNRFLNESGLHIKQRKNSPFHRGKLSLLKFTVTSGDASRKTSFAVLNSSRELQIQNIAVSYVTQPSA